MKRCLSLILSLLLIFTVTAPAEAAQEKKTFVLIGDSIAFGSCLAYPERDCYGALVCAAENYTYKNYAVPLHTSAKLIERLNEDKVALGVAAADIVGISIGGNNFLRGDKNEILNKALKGDYSGIDAEAEKFYGELREIMDIVKALTEEGTVILQTLYNPMEDSSDLGAVYDYTVEKVNGKIRAVAGLYTGCYVAEVGEAFRGKASGYLSSDNTHPNEKGHYAIANEYLSLLYETGLGEAGALEGEYTEAPSGFLERLILKIKELILSLLAMLNLDIGL